MRNANFGYAMAIAMFTLFIAIVLAVLSKRLTAERE
jgi:N-acetylglucosamine transport system permease protein